MRRISFAGDGLAEAITAEPDQQLKLYFPRPGHSEYPPPAEDFGAWYQGYLSMPEEVRPWMRSYTVRSYDPETCTLDVDFLLHRHAGPATRWAIDAQPGDRIGRFGPSAMFGRRIPLSTRLAEADWVLLAGDESAIPAMSTIIEACSRPMRAFIRSPYEYPMQTWGALDLHWGDPLDAVRGASLPAGRPFCWLAGEAGLVRDLRRHLVGERGIARSDIEFTGYWRSTLTQDDPPTAADLADAQELLAQG
ncbi:siderophore-interacting protein [Pseudonocardiaceae bacterium YIM PH 21723]|nr:siderophore-interacting protein [Pseudonocardiaceae bacterium YIM PH 21723]